MGEVTLKGLEAVCFKFLGQAGTLDVQPVQTKFTTAPGLHFRKPIF